MLMEVIISFTVKKLEQTAVLIESSLNKGETRALRVV